MVDKVVNAVIMAQTRRGVWTKFLPEALYEPQELEILGSVKMDFCILFSLPGSKQNKDKIADVTPNHITYRNVTSWCSFTARMITPSNRVPLQ